MGKKINDGGRIGLKQDKFRNSRFELDSRIEQDPHFGGVTKKTLTTLGGPFQENRGRRTEDEEVTSRWRGAFENGRFGGKQLDHEGSHFGKGPKGYKRSDESIYEDVCYTLYVSRDIDATGIEVKVQDGVVYLTGRVSDRRAKRLSELEIETISGVKDVQNQLSINPETQVPGRDFH